PKRGWVKLNTDGVVSTSTQSAAIGGVIHDDGGSWVCGYSMTLGKDEVFRIEARSMLEGLRLAWDKGYRQVELESDNALLVELVLAGNSTASHIVELHAIHKILHRNWKVQIRHIPRAHNEVAGFMAKHAAPRFTSILVFSIPPQAI
ncbi:hypothetical protein Godav_028878, partial [Gossypium davidsonii]|nr:hypothetical protein [Gossypium davidsonii]